MTPDELIALRKEIDRLDGELLSVLAQRMTIVKQVGKYKKSHSIAPLDTGRWNQVLESKLQLAEKLHVDQSLVKDIYERIHAAALEMESAV